VTGTVTGSVEQPTVGQVAPPAPGPLTRLAVRAVRAYQTVAAGRPSPCRFYPSCSTYAVEALETHGALHGGWLALRRVARCRPGGGHGIDLVPERKAP
jgi:putative membrane protein insertion efficiency factor